MQREIKQNFPHCGEKITPRWATRNKTPQFNPPAWLSHQEPGRTSWGLITGSKGRKIDVARSNTASYNAWRQPVIRFWHLALATTSLAPRRGDIYISTGKFPDRGNLKLLSSFWAPRRQNGRDMLKCFFILLISFVSFPSPSKTSFVLFDFWRIFQELSMIL